MEKQQKAKQAAAKASKNAQKAQKEAERAAGSTDEQRSCRRFRSHDGWFLWRDHRYDGRHCDRRVRKQ